MRPSDSRPENILTEEILAEARRQSEKAILHAQQEAKSLLAEAGAEADKAREEMLALAHAEALRRKELILATVPVEVGRMRSARVEALLQSVHEDVRRRLLACKGFDYRETVVALAAEAICRMAGDTFVVKVSVADCTTLGKGLAEDIARRTGRGQLTITILAEATITESGLIVQDIEGRQCWDNRLSARMERLWPEIRRQIAVATLLDAGSGSPGGGHDR